MNGGAEEYAVRWGSMLGAAAAVCVLVGGPFMLERLTTPNREISIADTTPPPGVTGDLTTLVHGFVSRIPGRGSGAFDRPSTDERGVMADAYRAIVAGDDTQAASLAGPLGYSVIRYTDVATGRDLVILAERQNPDQSWPHAWGLYVHSKNSTSNMTVEVPHPVADVDTELVGAEIFRLAGSANLFIAGAERNARADGSADVAHNARSVFEAIHEAVLTPQAIVVQPHGFESTGTDRDYGDLVLSSGSASPPEAIRQLAASFQKAGLRVCLYDGLHCQGLGGTTNIQGRSTRVAGGLFVHMEMDLDLRISRAESAKVVRLLVAILA